MLGQSILDPNGIEGPPGESKGLGLLDVTTTMTADKWLARTHALHVASQLPINAYEIHIGQSIGADRLRPFAMIGDQPEGAISPDGLTTGSYLHGMFVNDAFRTAYLAGLGARVSGHSYAAGLDATLNALAAHMERHLDVTGLLALAR